MNLCSIGLIPGNAFGSASIYVLDTTSASLLLSLTPEKKTGWERLARSVR